jgi:hypothetical protein
MFVKKIVILTYKIFTAVFADEFSFRPVTVYLPHMQLVRVRSPVFPKQFNSGKQSPVVKIIR